MASLLDTLTTSFTSGGFDLSSAVSGLGSAAGSITPTGVDLDQGALSGIGQRIGGGDFGSIGSTVTGVLGQASSVAAGMPQSGALVQPLADALGKASTLATANPRDLLQLFEQAAAAGDGSLGMTALAGPIAALSSVRSNALVATVIQLLTSAVPGGLALDQTISQLGDQATGIAALVRLVGALMSTEALTREVATTTQTIASMLDGGGADGALAQLATAANASLVDLIAGASPDDPDEVAAVVPAVAAFADAIRAAADRLVGGMAFGEATLVGADLDSVAAGVTQAARLLDEAALGAVRALAIEAAGWFEPLLRVDLGSPAASVDAFVGDLTGLVGKLAAAIDAIDPAAIARPVSNGLAAALAPLHEVEAIANQVTATIRSAFQTAQQAISSIDLRPVTQAIHMAVQPAVDALHDLDQLIGAAQTDLETLANDLTTALTGLRQVLDDTAGKIHDAFNGVKQTVDGLHLEDLQATVQNELQSVANTLETAQLKPYFDTAIQALDTAKTVVAAVPVSLLPDDTKQELDQAVQPIKDIDFDTDVRDVLEQQLDAILTALNTSVLDEIDQLYQQVVAFIQSIDPRAALTQFEQDDFDPMLARIQAVDPTEILKPVSNVIDDLKAAVARVDLRHDVLGPLEDAFDELEQGFARLDPAVLLQPLEEEVGQLHDEIVRVLQLDEWQARLALVDPFVTQLLARLDFDTLVSLLDAAWTQLEPAQDPTGASALATVVSGLLEGTGLTIRMDSLGAVSRWIGGADASAAIAARLTAAADDVDGVVAVVQRVDPQALGASVQPAYTAVTGAVAALPPGSLLRDQLEPLLAGASPLDLLGTAIDNRNRYLGSLNALSTLLRGLASSARSELNAIAQGLRDALRPLTSIPDRVKALFARIGLDVANKTFRMLVRELFQQVAPSRLLAPLSPAITSLKAKVATLVHEALVTPLADALTTVKGALDALDISFIRTSLQSLHDQIAADIHQLRPSVLLADMLNAFDETKATIAAFDPLAPVRTAINAMKAAIDNVANHYRPTILLAPVLDLYDEIVKALGTLDVHKLLDPILKALNDIKTQLDDGLDGTAAALKQLQAALP
jgi:hypothetical protein